MLCAPAPLRENKYVCLLCWQIFADSEKQVLESSRRGAGAQRFQQVIWDLFRQAIHAACDTRLHHLTSKIE
jgi:hypothetical protein